MLAKSNAADYDIVLGSWAPDYDDPLAYAEAMTNKYGDGSRVFESSEFDREFAIASTSNDAAQRNAAFREMHSIVAAEVPVLPLFVYNGTLSLYVQDPRLKNVRRSMIAGNPNFNYAHIE